MIALGSNLPGALPSPLAQLQYALKALDSLAFSQLLKVSSAYQSPAWSPEAAASGISAGPDYVNAVALLKTELAPDALLAALLQIEADQGRSTGDARYAAGRYAPRTLDLDLMTYGELQLRSTSLTLPHPGLHLRDFVLAPLLEIAHDFKIPGLGKAHDFFEQMRQQNQVKRSELSAARRLPDALWPVF